MPSHAIILGCGRSGTSIFGELFEGISDYCYYSEPDFADVLKLSFIKPTAIKVPRESLSYPAPKGMSFPLSVLFSSMPSPPTIFWQVRHPLDAISSLRPGIANNWGHHPKPHDWQEWQTRPLIEQCAHHWAYINTVGFNAVKDLAKVCHFESMLRDPMAFAISTCNKIGLNYHDYNSELEKWADRVQDTNNEKFVEALTSRSLSRPDHKHRMGRWRENLSEQEVKSVLPIIKTAAKNFGYDLHNDVRA